MRELDLSSSVEAVMTLLDTEIDWRARSVEHLTFTTELTCLARRSVQVTPLNRFLPRLEGSLEKARVARLVLPIGMFPKRPLLDFDVRVDERAAYLLKRVDIADLQAEYVIRSLEGRKPSEALRSLITSICEFTPGQWIQIREKGWTGRLLTYLNKSGPLGVEIHGRVGRLSHVLRTRLLCSKLQTYLRDSMGDTVADSSSISRQLVEGWVRECTAIAKLLEGYLREPPSIDSSSDLSILAMPLVANRGQLNNVGQISERLLELRKLCEEVKAHEVDQQEAGLSVLAEYGRRWEAMVQCTVPIDAPFLVTTCETRPANIECFGWVWEDVIFADAQSSHLVMKAADDVAVISDIRARDAYGTDLQNFVTAVRQTDEVAAVYSSDGDRDYFARFGIRFVAYFDVRVVGWVIEMITYLGIAIIIRKWAILGATDLAVIAVPTTFAASVLLSRERTSLGTHLLRWSRRRLLFALMTLWGMVGYLYLSSKVAGF